MKPFQLTGTTPDGQTAHVWACGICRCARHDEKAATECCTCSYCGKPVEKDKYGARHTSHDECRNADWARQDQERLDKAVEVTDYFGPFLLGDDYCEGMEDVVEQLECNTEPGDEWPEFIYACKEKKPCLKIDLDDLQHKVEDLWEDADLDDFNGVPELEAAMRAFNAANADRAVYREDRTRKVRIPRQEPRA
jgi:hypothetical protein